VASICAGLPWATRVAAGVAGAGAKVDDEIGAADGVFVVLDDENGVAEVAKLFERAEKARVVRGRGGRCWGSSRT